MHCDELFGSTANTLVIQPSSRKAILSLWIIVHAGVANVHQLIC